MNCGDFRNVVAEYVVGTLDPDEMSACDAHVAQPIHDEDCREALSRAQRAAEEIGQAIGLARPPARLWGRIRARIASPRSALARAGWMPWALGMLLLATLVVAWGTHASLQRRIDRAHREFDVALRKAAQDLRTELDLRQMCQRDLAAAGAQSDAFALLARPDTRLAILGGAAGHALVLSGPDRGLAIVSVVDDGKDYELRAAGKPVATFRPDTTGLASVPLPAGASSITVAQGGTDILKE
jgi:hypothetical protein